MSLPIPDGVFPSVALAGGAGALAVRQGDPRVPGWLVVYRFPVADPAALTELTRFGLSAGSPCFPNLYALDGLLWLAFHDGQQQRLVNLATGREERFVALSNPSAFGAGCFAYTDPWPPYPVYRFNLRTGARDCPRLGAPTGLSRIDWHGDVITIDEDRLALPGATIPSFAGIALAVGEGPAGGVVWESFPGTDKAQRGTLWAGLDSFTPKCAAEGETLAIATAGSGSVRLFCGPLSELVAASHAGAEQVPGPLVNSGTPVLPPVGGTPSPQLPTPKSAPVLPPVEPSPRHFQESHMIAYAPPVSGFKPGDLVDNGNGTVSVKKPNGKFLCITPDGQEEERDTPGGAWESFTKGKASLLADRDGGPTGPRVFVLPLAE